MEDFKDQAEQKVVIIAKNNVEVHKVLYDKNNKEIIIEKTGYGLPQVSAQIDIFDTEIANWQNQVWINAKISTLQAERAKWVVVKDKLLESLGL